MVYAQPDVYYVILAVDAKLTKQMRFTAGHVMSFFPLLGTNN